MQEPARRSTAIWSLEAQQLAVRWVEQAILTLLGDLRELRSSKICNDAVESAPEGD
jgi:hypothetical protein